jgi:hypothetical protein
VSQLSFTEIVEDVPEMSDEGFCALYRSMTAIAASTLLEFETALAWGQWCRRTAAQCIAETKGADYAQAES